MERRTVLLAFKVKDATAHHVPEKATLASLPEDPGSIPSNHTEARYCLKHQMDPSSGFCGHQVYTWCTYIRVYIHTYMHTYIQAHIHSKIKKKNQPHKQVPEAWILGRQEEMATPSLQLSPSGCSVLRAFPWSPQSAARDAEKGNLAQSPHCSDEIPAYSSWETACHTEFSEA